MSQHFTRRERTPAQTCVFCQEPIGRRLVAMTPKGVMHRRPCFSDWQNDRFWVLVDLNTEAMIRSRSEAVRSERHDPANET